MESRSERVEIAAGYNARAVTRLGRRCERLPYFAAPAQRADPSGDQRNPPDRVIGDEHHDGADYCDQHAPEIEPRNACRAEKAEQPSSDYRADDAQHDMRMIPSPVLLTTLLPMKPRNQSKHDPGQNGHRFSPLCRLCRYRLSSRLKYYSTAIRCFGVPQGGREANGTAHPWTVFLTPDKFDHAPVEPC